MLGKFIEYEADKTEKYYRVIQTINEYADGRKFPIDEVVKSDMKVNINAIKKDEIGGFCISKEDFIFRWLVRGDTLCEVIIPEDSKIYKTVSKNGIYVSDKIILTNPQKVDDNLATKLYLNSCLPEESYFKAIAACVLKGYINTAFKVCDEKVNKVNKEKVIEEINDFTKRRKDENFIISNEAKERIDKLYDRIRKI